MSDLKRVELYYIFAAYIAFVLGIAVYIFLQNKTKTAALGDGEMVSDHFLAGRKTPVVLLVLTTFSTVFSGYTMIGVPDEAYEFGFPALKWAGTTISIAISFAIITPRLRTISEYRNYSSPIDFVTDRYHSESLRILILSALWVSDFIYLSGQFSAISALVETVTEDQVPGYAGAIFMGVIILLLESLGGLKSVMLTDAIQSCFMIFSFLVVPFLLNELFGDFSDLLESKDCEETEFGSCGLNEQKDPYKQYPSTLQTTAMASSVFGFFSYSILPQCIHRIYTSDSADSLRVTVTSIAYCPYFTMIPGIFMGLVCAARLNEDSDGTAFGIISGELYDRGGFKKVVSCIMMCAGLAAISSTADSALIAMSHLVSEDLYQKKFRPGATQTETVLISKLCSLIVVVMAICMTLNDGFDVSRAAQIQIGFQIQAWPAFFFGLFPEILGFCPSSRSLVWGFVTSITVLIVVYTCVSAGVSFYFDPGTWGFVAYMLHIYIFEKFYTASNETCDDNKRKFDRPPERAYAHFPKEKYVDGSSKQVEVSVQLDALQAPPHPGNQRLNDHDVMAMAALNLNEPFGSKTNKIIITLLAVLIVLLLPWFEEPNSETEFSSGWPVWAIVYIGYIGVATIVLTVLLSRWEVMEHQKDIDILATAMNPIENLFNSADEKKTTDSTAQQVELSSPTAAAS